MKCKFNYDDIVRVQPRAAARAGDRAWIVGIFLTKPEGGYFDRFPDGIVYSIEFEDGSSTEIHEADLRLDDSDKAKGKDPLEFAVVNRLLLH